MTIGIIIMVSVFTYTMYKMLIDDYVPKRFTIHIDKGLFVVKRHYWYGLVKIPYHIEDEGDWRPIYIDYKNAVDYVRVHNGRLI